MEPKDNLITLTKSKMKKKSSTKKPTVKTDSDIEDDDPFLPCDSKKWSLEIALEYIRKFNIKKVNKFIESDIASHDNFYSFPSRLIAFLFRFYTRLETDIQNGLRIFYFGLETSEPLRFRNLTKSLRQNRIFKKYPWLDPENKSPETSKVKEQDNVSKPIKAPKSSKKRKIKITESSTKKETDAKSSQDNIGECIQSKPFTEACKQYEIEVLKCKKIKNSPNQDFSYLNKTCFEPDLYKEPVNILNQNGLLQQWNNTNTHNSAQITNFLNNPFNNMQSLHVNTQISFTPTVNIIDPSPILVPKNVVDQHLLLSQEYQNMIAAIECSNQTQISEKCTEIQSSATSKETSTILEKKTSRWSSSLPPENNIIKNTINNRKRNLEITNAEKRTPIMHFEKRKIKLTAQVPLSLGDLIVLVSFFYKLEYMEQQLLIGKMKILEATKPNQAAYLRQYVRIKCPSYNENIIRFKPLPEDLVASEKNMDLHNVTCIDDILEKDFCVSEDIHEKRIKIDANLSDQVLNDTLQGNKMPRKEFDFGSEFL